MNGIKKRAFTLAELLIVLGIIGIIAALTMPALIANHKKQETVTKLKKTVSILNQAMKLSEVDNGEYQHWDDSYEMGAPAYFDKYWRPYLNILKECNTYKACDYNSNTPFVHANNSTDSGSFIAQNLRTAVRLSDGVTLVIYTGVGYSNGTTGSNNQVRVDLNGGNKPNKYGRDVFQLTRTSTGILPDGYDKTDSVINSNCSKTGTGAYCAAKIMRDGWQIKDDYPW